MSVSTATSDLTSEEREIIRYAVSATNFIRSQEVCILLQVGKHTARKRLQTLTVKGWLKPAGNGKKRVHAYELDRTRTMEGFFLR